MPTDVVRDAGGADAAGWNDFLDSVPGSSPLARYAWRDVLEQSYGVATHFLLVERAGRITGVLGGYATRDLFGARNFYSLRCGLVAQDAGAASALLQAVVQRRGKHGWQSALTTSGWHAWPGLAPELVRCTVQIPIDPDPERMWSGLKDKTRNMIRRAEKQGVTVASGLHYVDILVDHYHANMLRLGIPIHSRAYFHRLVEALAPQTEILVASLDGKPVASMMLLFGRDVATYPYQNVHFTARKTAAIQILNWSAMQRCAERRMTVLDMGESRADSPVFRSKTSFGGASRDSYYYRPFVTPDSGGVPRAVRAGASLVYDWLASRSPMPLRRHFAQRRLVHGRLS